MCVIGASSSHVPLVTFVLRLYDTIMPVSKHEHTLNVALGEVLGQLRRSWQTRTEQTGQVLAEGGRPDMLIEEASGWPIIRSRRFS